MSSPSSGHYGARWRQDSPRLRMQQPWASITAHSDCIYRLMARLHRIVTRSCICAGASRENPIVSPGTWTSLISEGTWAPQSQMKDGGCGAFHGTVALRAFSQ